MTLAKEPSVRSRLRAVTDDIHQALHQAAPFAAVADGSLDRAGYGDVLAMLHTYHREFAGACAAGAAALHMPLLTLAHGARLVALEQDLKHLGHPPRIVDDTLDARGLFAAGCLYTVQGSTLGGKVIYRQLDYLLPDDNGRRFFRGAGDDSQAWQDLCAGLETHGAEDSDALEQGALFAFHRFADVLQQA
jgi:heme oxygenase